MGKIISVWGSPSSGKTTFSIKLANALKSKKNSVIIVFTDNVCPVVPTLVPNADTSKSLGNILTDVELTRDLILKNSLTVDNVDNIAFVGYASYENILSYATYQDIRVFDFFNTLRYMADYIIVDTSSFFSIDLLSTIALEVADKVIRLNTSSLKSWSYFNSNVSLIKNSKFNIDNHINVLSNFKESDAVDAIKDICKIHAEFPYMDGIREQSICTELFYKLKTKEENKLNQKMRTVVDLINEEKISEKNKSARSNVFSKFRMKVGVSNE